MGNTMLEIYQLIATSFSILSMLVYVGGFCACTIYRRLSSMLLLAAAGFAGLFASSALVRLSTLGFQNWAPDMMFLSYITAAVLDVISNLMLVAGLWYAFAQLRRQLALSLEPTHGRS